MQQLQQAAQGNDIERLQALSHSLKSSSANVGALSLSAVARRIELEARSGSLQRPAVAVALLVAEFARARVALTGYLADQSPLNHSSSLLSRYFGSPMRSISSSWVSSQSMCSSSESRIFTNSWRLT